MKTITLCGSMTFIQNMVEAKALLEAKGFTVLIPHVLMSEDAYAKEYGREELLRMKPSFMTDHFDKIQKSDAIIVMNYEKKGIPGYFGSNTLMEVGVAFFLGKDITFLHLVTEDHPHFEEAGTLPSTCLNGDIETYA